MANPLLPPIDATEERWHALEERLHALESLNNEFLETIKALQFVLSGHRHNVGDGHSTMDISLQQIRK